MTTPLAERWRDTFFATLRQPIHAAPLQQATLRGELGTWTAALTHAVVANCTALGWHAAAKGHRLAILPQHGEEYLALDVTAFADAPTRWRYPVAVFELENSASDDRIAYALWKVLCVRAQLRVMYCYRRNADGGAPLVRMLATEVVQALGRPALDRLEGTTLVVVGNRGTSETFPYSFFRWWRLEPNTAVFEIAQ